MSDDRRQLFPAVDTLAAADWHALMQKFSDLHYEQTAIYGDSHNQEDQSTFVLRDADAIVGGARVGIIRLPVLGRGMALVRFGPFWRPVGAQADISQYRSVIGALIDEYCTKQKLYLVVRPRAHPDFYPQEAAVLREVGLKESDATVLDRLLVDASLSEEDQLKSLDQGWRSKLRKAMKHGVEIKLCDDPAGAATFAALYAQMVDRKHLNYDGVERAESVPDLMALPDSMRLHTVIAYLNGQPIAGATFAVVGDVAYYVFGASSAPALAVNAGYLLQWHILAWLRERAVRWYELGGQGDPGIAQFKKGFAGKRGVLLPMREFHYAPDIVASALVASLFKLRDLRNALREWQRARENSRARAA